ncbi:alpha/beta-hydrolase [Aspergillus cavernicola]|uniref:Alpha/beta-hydrolase n=1 Tax=Aspergillus cavernicola TaxID=176166 RepID=A0ABR4HQJ4_9EURO
MSRFSPFTRIDLTYRIIHGTPLEASILIPATTPSAPRHHDKKHPVIVRWHGGGFVVGHRMYEPWFAQWLLDLAIDHEAIIITPDYRLLPESNGSSILSDVAHFWRWMQTDLLQYIEHHALPQPDISNILCCGESSGGFISVYCALHLNTMLLPSPPRSSGQQVRIQAVISISAPLDATAPEYKVPRPRVFMGRSPPPPRQALAKIRAYIKGMPPGSIRTGCEPTSEMWDLLLCIAQQAFLPRLFGMGAEANAGAEGGLRSTSTLEGLMEIIQDRKMVPVWIVHGINDTMCPSVCSSGFAHRLREIQPDVPVHLSLCPGEHLFDVNADRDAEWVREGARFLNNHWPQFS